LAVKSLICRCKGRQEGSLQKELGKGAQRDIEMTLLESDDKKKGRQKIDGKLLLMMRSGIQR